MSLSSAARPLDGRQAVLKLRNSLVHSSLEMCESGEKFGLKHELNFCAGVRDPPFDIAEAAFHLIEPAIVAAQEVHDLKQHGPMLVGIGPDLLRDRQH
jgi:hypothetical protein